MINYRRRRVRVEAIVWDGVNLLEAARLLGGNLAAFERRTGSLSVTVGSDEIEALPDMWLIVDEEGNPHPPTTNAIFEQLYEPMPDATT
jgi:hypothetical protein